MRLVYLAYLQTPVTWLQLTAGGMKKVRSAELSLGRFPKSLYLPLLEEVVLTLVDSRRCVTDPLSRRPTQGHRSVQNSCASTIEWISGHLRPIYSVCKDHALVFLY